MQTELEIAAQRLRKEASAGKAIRIVTHYDADGLSAGAIAHLALAREGFAAHTRSVKQLDGQTLSELNSDEAIVIFTDIGSGQLDAIKEHIKTLAIVLDHHQPKDVRSANILHVNPHVHGIDGAREISGSGMAYLFARSLNPNNADLAALAIVGAVGDLQDSEGELRGLNRNIVQDAVAANVLRADKDLRLFGRQTRPLYKALEYTTEPFIPGLSGSESACVQFLSDLDIPLKRGESFTMLADLSSEERQRLVTALILKMIEQRVPPRFAESIVGEVFTLLKEEKRTPLRDAREFATLLNACGKNEKAGIGLAIAMGERDALYGKALEMLKEHKGYLLSCYAWISQNLSRIKSEEHFYYMHAGSEINENVIGTLVGMVLNARVLNPAKPIVAFSETQDGAIKVSARATRELVERGFNLGRAMLYASEKIGAEGGGHDIAAGAKIKKGGEDEFLKYVKEELARQANASEGKS